MGVRGKLVSQISIKTEGDLFKLFTSPNNFPKISPEKIQSVDLQAGQWGTIGSVVFWKYTIDGKEKVAKEIIEAVDVKKRSINYKVIEGDLMEFYNSFNIIAKVDRDGEDKQLVTWTFEYEKKSEAVPDPCSLMDYALSFTKEIEGHSQLVPN